MRLLSLAWRNLLRNVRRSLAVILALIVAVCAMVCLRGYINGVHRITEESLVYGQVGAIQIHKRGYVGSMQAFPLNITIADTAQLRQTIGQVPGVTGVAPRITFGAMLSMPTVFGSDGRVTSEGRSTILLVTAVDPASELKAAPRRYAGILGRGLSTGKSNEIVLNKDLADQMGLKVRATESPVSEWPSLLSNDPNGVLTGENLQLVGTVPSISVGLKLAIAPLTTVQKMLRMDGLVTELAVGVDDLSHAGAIRDRLKASLGPQYEVQTWDEVVPGLRDVQAMESQTLTMVMGMFLVIVLIAIVNASLINVLYRFREIGTMLALGMRRGQIVTLFLSEAMLLGLFGATLGIVSGRSLVALMSYVGIALPIRGNAIDNVMYPFIGNGELVGILIFAALGSTLATVAAAVRASRLRPVEALQALCSSLTRIALLNVGRNKRRTFLTICATTFGVVAILTMCGIDGGFWGMSRDAIDNWWGALQIHRSGYMNSLDTLPLSMSIPYTPEMMAKIRNVPGVRGVAGRLRFVGLVSNGRAQTPFFGTGIDMSHEKEACPEIGFNIKPGDRYLTPADYAQVLVGAPLARSFASAQGEDADAPPSGSSLTLTATNNDGRTNSLDVAMKGSVLLTPVDPPRTVIMPLKLTQDLLGMQGLVSEYIVGVKELPQATLRRASRRSSRRCSALNTRSTRQTSCRPPSGIGCIASTVSLASASCFSSLSA